MRKIIPLLILLLTISIPVFTFAQPANPTMLKERDGVYIYHKDQTIYWCYTNDPITIAWSPGERAVGYEIQVSWIRGDVVVQNYPRYSTTNLEYTLFMPRAGIFIVAVRSWMYASDGITKIYSEEWAKSNDPLYAVVDNEPKAWIIVASLSAPGPITPR